MTALFWILAAAMLLLGVGLVVAPLIGRGQVSVFGRGQKNVEIARERLNVLEQDREANLVDEAQFEQSRQEIEQILANDLAGDDGQPQINEDRSSSVAAAVSVGLAIPLLTVLLYMNYGNSQGLEVGPDTIRETAGQKPANRPLGSVSDMVEKLAQRLQQNPDNPKGWRLLARSYMVMKRTPDAVSALRRARGLVGDEPDVLVELADALATLQSGSFDGEPSALLSKVLADNPEHPGALWLAGRSAIESQKLALALEYWRKLEALLPKGAEGADSIRLAIARVEQAMGSESQSQESPAPKSQTTGKQQGSPQINVKVGLSKALSSAVDPQDTLFVYAQAMTGPPMPLAISRMTASDLPVQVALNDSMAMMPAMKLSKFSQVRVIARISKSGSAMPQSGDLKGQAEAIQVGQTSNVEITIDETIP